MPLHPMVVAMLEKRATLPPMNSLPVEEVRAGDLARFRTGLPLVEVARVEDRDIPGPGGSLPIRIYTPLGVREAPVVVYLHGGGYAICSIDTHEEICRRICAGTRAIVVSVGYRLAPEHKFPAAPDDCLFAARWVAEHAAEFGGQAQAMAIAGDSAGGTLAAVTAMRIRDEGGPPLRGIVMAYASTDYFAQTHSRTAFATGYGFTLDLLNWLRGMYLRSPEDGHHPFVSPLRARSLKGLPPALVMTAEYDPLRDEGEAFAARLNEEGVPARVSRCEGMTHGFLFWGGKVDRSTAAIEEICAWLREALGTTPP